MKTLLLVFLACFLLGAKPQTHQPCYKADVLFVIDYSSSLSEHLDEYEPWLRGIVYNLPLSENLKAGFLFFSGDVCPIYCPLTDESWQIDEKILLAQKCPSDLTYIEPALIKSDELFHLSEIERGEVVSKVIVLVTDSDVSDEIEACQFVDSEMSNVSFILVDLYHGDCYARVEYLIDCMTRNRGTYLDGFSDVYKELLKRFDPCS